MRLLKTLVRGLSEAPGYTLMRGVARFAVIRNAVARARALMQGVRLRAYLAECEARMDQSVFSLAESPADRDRHAHLFNRDLDDFPLFKSFFYLTNVKPVDGGHLCVLGSHRCPPHRGYLDRRKLRQCGEEEVAALYSGPSIREIAGTAFAENTLCIHKGRTPTDAPKSPLQVQFALFECHLMHHRRAAALFQPLDGGVQPQ
jgi:hypothetical protein